MTEEREGPICHQQSLPNTKLKDCSKRATQGQTSATICWVQLLKVKEKLLDKTVIGPTIHCQFLQTT